MLPTTKPGDGDDFAMLRFGVATVDTIPGEEAQLPDGLHVGPGVGADAPPVASTEA